MIERFSLAIGAYDSDSDSDSDSDASENQAYCLDKHDHHVILANRPISDHVSLPRECDSLLKVHPYSCVFLCTAVEQRNDTLGNDTWSEMGKHCHATGKAYIIIELNWFCCQF